jgi:Holliday junction resolvase RusA-like endonuclease
MDTQDMLTGAAQGAPSLKASAVRFTVPGQPQGKGRPRVGQIAGHARMFTPQKTVAYEGFIALQAQIAMQHHALLEGPVAVRIFIACQVPESKSKKWKADALAGLILPTTKPDKDNVIKAVFDALNGVVWKDDVQVCDLDSKKRYSTQPRVEVEIVPIGVAAAPPARAQTGQGLLLEAVA